MPTIIDAKYLDLISSAINQGEYVEDGHKKMFSIQNQIVVFQETPLVTIRKTAWKTALREMEWFLSGSSNLNNAHPSVHPWWKPWADDGKILNSYGEQFRYAGADNFDQLRFLLRSLKERPKGRSNLITTWNSEDMEVAPIHNCHGTVIKFRLGEGGLELTMIQRSADLILGVPHNWIQYWALGEWVGRIALGESLEKFTWIGLDCHVYEDHLSLAQRMVLYKSKHPFAFTGPLAPSLGLKLKGDLDFNSEHFVLSADNFPPVFTDKPKLIV